MNEEMLLSYLINLFVRSFVTIYHQVLNAYIEKMHSFDTLIFFNNRSYTV